MGSPLGLVQSLISMQQRHCDRVSNCKMSNEGKVTRVTVDLIFTGAYTEDTGVYDG